MKAADRELPDFRPRVGLSACMTGLPVRYDGSDRFSRQCMEHLARVIDWLPLCPEVAVGLGTPRPTIDLFREGGAIIARNRQDPTINPTTELQDFANCVSRKHAELCGYVFMARSPSCAVGSARLYRGEELLCENEPGIFVRQWRDNNPLLPVLESSQLDSPGYVLHFLVGVYLTAAAAQAPGDGAPQQLSEALMPLVRALSGNASEQASYRASSARLIQRFLVGEWPKLQLAETENLRRIVAGLAGRNTGPAGRLCAALLEAAGPAR